MKNIQLIAFLFGLWLLGGSLCLFAQADTPSVTLRSDYDFAKNEIINSTKINIPFFEFRGALNTDFSKKQIDFENLKWNYGVELSTQKLFPKLKILFKTGNLTGTGSLPQYNNFNFPQGYFGEINWTSSKTVKKLSINVLYKSNADAENDILTSTALLKIKPFNKFLFTVSSTAGLYPYDKKKISTWFSNQKYYHAGKHICFTNQISLAANGSSTVFTVNTFQSPFDEFLNTWQFENKIKSKNFSFTLNGFYNPNDEVITSASKIINPLLQLEFGGQYKFFTETKNPYSITTGINTQADINLAEKTHTMKTQTDFQYSGGVAKGYIKASMNFKLTNEADGIKTNYSGGSIDTSNSFFINDFSPTITAKFTFTPDSKKTKWTFTEKIGVNFEYEKPGGKITFTNKNQISFTQKTGDSRNKIGFTSSLSAKFVFRFCSLLFHLEFQV